MCFNMAILLSDEELFSEVKDDIIDVIADMSQFNSDGFSIHYVGSKSRVVRTLDLYSFIEEIEKIDKAKMIHVHLRARTSGDISIDNVHMWRVGDFYFSHNGFVLSYVYSVYKEHHRFSDSYMLAHDKEFINTVMNNPEDLPILLSDRDFHGTAILSRVDGSEVLAYSNATMFLLIDDDVAALSNVLVFEGQKPLRGLYRITNCCSVEKIADAVGGYRYYYTF